MNNYIQPGVTMTVTNNTGTARESGDAILVGSRVAILTGPAAAGAEVEAMFAGVFRVPKATGTNTGGAMGEPAYWDNTARNFTAVADDNTLAGYFADAAGDSDATCIVKLTG